MIGIKQRIIFLDKIHLFNGLKEEQLSGIAQTMSEKEISNGDVIFKRNAKPDGFYLIYKGRVKVTRPYEKGEEQFLAWLVAGDYFGEEALFENRNRSATVTAMEDCVLLFLPRKRFEELIQNYEKLKPNFKVSIKSRKLARATKFKWLGANEVIYFIARRHILRLYRVLLAPALALLIPFGLFAVSGITSAVTPLAVGVASLFAIIAWGIWNAIDWGNDYYIVTNQRVILLEKVIGLHDSRQEAPLSTILSVGVETDMVGRVLDFGNVIVRTFVGKVAFDDVDHPAQAADMIREYWERTKMVTNVSQQDVMKNTIRQKLGLPVEKKELPPLPPVVPADEEKIAQTPLWVLAISDLFKLRLEDGGTVTYRKHWIILLQQAWKPVFALFGIFALIFWRLSFLIQSPERAFFEPNANGAMRPDALSLTLVLLMMPIAFWLWYEYTDWKNDVFMITDDEIFDIDRKPFGKEERRAAQIESILSISYKRDGFIAYFFNYGTVHISVGGNQLSFDDVIDPAGVQSDINRRRMVRIAKKNESAGSADRERFATWIAAYHQNLAEFDIKAKNAPELVAVQKLESENDEEDGGLGLELSEDDAQGLDQSMDGGGDFF
ncbi:MAG: cyclic nucleotide-binding domain-containing protein [Anaerolineales bacterium]|nr:cyclic nucleotide-binding domain-containing protein [Anaerolineales bacterium]